MNENEGISLFIKSKEVSASTFVTASHKLLLLLKEVETSMSKEDNPKLNWIINNLSIGSAGISVMSYDDNLPITCAKVCNSVAVGLKILKEKVERPPFFSNTALKYAKEITSAINKEPTYISTKEIEADLDYSIAINADKLLVPSDELGAIEGIIKMVTKAGAFKCNLYDSVTGTPVKCNLNEKQLKEIMTSFVNDQRVAISGIISYTADGYPKFIKEITDIYIFPPDNELPKLDDILNSDIDLTGGLSFKEFMERKHDHEF